MDINSKIRWTPGMPLTTCALNFLDETFNRRKDTFVRVVLGSRAGILPGVDFSCDAMFVGTNLEIKVKQCRAWLPSGRLMDIVEDQAKVPVPSLQEGEYFLCAAFGDEKIEFESCGIPFERPVYKYSIQSFEDLRQSVEYMPLLKLVVDAGNVSIDRDYIVPCMQLDGDQRLYENTKTLSVLLQKVASHPNVGGDTDSLVMSHFGLASAYYDHKTDTLEYLRFTVEMSNYMSYFYLTDEARERIGKVAPSVFDIQKWFNWLHALIDEALKFLDNLVLENKHIDIDALREEITADVYKRIRSQLDEDIQKMKDTLRDEILEKLSVSLREFIEGEFRGSLHDVLHEQLSDELKDSLYTALYTALYEALFVPEKEEEVFVPTI